MQEFAYHCCCARTRGTCANIFAQLSYKWIIYSLLLLFFSQRTRDELIPFIADSTDDDNDDVLCAIAEKLGELIQYVGGDEYLYRLLNPLGK